MSRITILMDNGMPEGFESEHGFAALIEHQGFCLLFDTGASDTVVRNAQRLGIDLAGIDAVLLSHGHHDHTGGLAAVLDRNKSARIYLHPNAMVPRYGRRPGKPAHYNGMPVATAQRLLAQESRLTWTQGPTRLADGVFVTGSIPRLNDFEDTGGSFFEDPEGTRPDGIVDDQAIWIETDCGSLVVTGCAHAGIVNTLDRIVEVSGEKRIHAVIGGLHLERADERRMKRTIEELERHGVERLFPLHCTGRQARTRLAESLPNKVLLMGDVLQFS